jgi:hypothetical protein
VARIWVRLQFWAEVRRGELPEFLGVDGQAVVLGPPAGRESELGQWQGFESVGRALKFLRVLPLVILLLPDSGFELGLLQPQVQDALGRSH